jgi:hypothetical protein
MSDNSILSGAARSESSTSAARKSSQNLYSRPAKADQELPGPPGILQKPVAVARPISFVDALKSATPALLPASPTTSEPTSPTSPKSPSPGTLAADEFPALSASIHAVPQGPIHPASLLNKPIAPQAEAPVPAQATESDVVMSDVASAAKAATTAAAKQPSTVEKVLPPATAADTAVATAPKPKDGAPLLLRIPRKAGTQPAARQASSSPNSPAPFGDAPPLGGRKYTPGPFPARHHAELHVLESHIAKRQLATWNTLPTRNAYAIPFAPGPVEGHNATATAIQFVLADLLGASGVKVAPPIPSIEAKLKNLPPVLFLIHNLVGDEAEGLAEVTSVGHSNGTAFTVVPFSATRSTLVALLSGLTSLVPTDVASFIVERLQEDDALDALRFLCEQTTNHANPLTMDMLGAVIDSLTVSIIELLQDGIPYPQYAVHCNSALFLEDTHWAGFAGIIRALQYETALDGTGYALTSQWLCKICLGIDHPTGICPFPRLPGWLGPVHVSTRHQSQHPRDADASQHNDNDSWSHSDNGFRGRGGRGGSRGGGRGGGRGGRRGGGRGPMPNHSSWADPK